MHVPLHHNWDMQWIDPIIHIQRITFSLRKLSDFFIIYISLAFSSIFRGKLEMNCVMHIIATTVHITMCIKLHKLYFESYRAWEVFIFCLQYMRVHICVFICNEWYYQMTTQRVVVSGIVPHELQKWIQLSMKYVFCFET